MIIFGFVFLMQILHVKIENSKRSSTHAEKTHIDVPHVSSMIIMILHCQFQLLLAVEHHQVKIAPILRCLQPLLVHVLEKYANVTQTSVRLAFFTPKYITLIKMS